jgi:hypothetical protein
MCVEPWQHPGSINTDCMRKKRKTPVVAFVCNVDTRTVEGSKLTNSQGRPTGKATGKQRGKTVRMILPGLALITPALWNPTRSNSPPRAPKIQESANKHNNVGKSDISWQSRCACCELCALPIASQMGLIWPSHNRAEKVCQFPWPV